ncbi:hypothetical protein X759_15795 [Mesorhizobium sp. LSHC420B00]|nr:hypothetical protein X759_15795 [Mesorhizobium sp. LSHC420B00]
MRDISRKHRRGEGAAAPLMSHHLVKRKPRRKPSAGIVE